MATPVVQVDGLKKHFPLRRGLAAALRGEPPPTVRAVDGVDLQVLPGEVLGLVGESGCGKTTTGRVVLRLLEPTEGRILFQGDDITPLSDEEMVPIRRKMQIIFQDPYESMNPRMDVLRIVSEPLRIQKLLSGRGSEAEDLVARALVTVDLTPVDEFLHRYPHELSGGQRQRVAVARALVLEPDFIVADEPVSMLDVSIRGGVLNLMQKLARERGVAFLYITHDLALARHVCDRVAVMYLGKIAEYGTVEQVVKQPRHPYTQALVAAVLVPDPSRKSIQVVMKGEVPNPANPPRGCRLHPRCPLATEVCREEEPPLADRGDGHHVACHLV